MAAYSTLAEAFRYPAPGQIDRLEQSLSALPGSAVKAALQAFYAQIIDLSLGDWEELYTRTWDLNPLTPPYIGFQIWGEDYRRGSFLARLLQAYREAGIETAGELADHLVPVLSYLDAASEPAAELVDVFGQSVEKMAAVLQKRDPSNPYLCLLKAIAILERQMAKTSEVGSLEKQK